MGIFIGHSCVWISLILAPVRWLQSVSRSLKKTRTVGFTGIIQVGLTGRCDSVWPREAPALRETPALSPSVS